MSEKKEPPSEGVDVLVRLNQDVNGDEGDFTIVARHHDHPQGWSIPGIGLRTASVVDWCELAEWSDLVAAPGAAARLADAQARLDKAEQHARALEASVEQERRLLRHASEERELFRSSVLHEQAVNKVLQARVLELEAAADAAAEREASEKHAWVVANETANERDTLGRERDAALARAERAEKERDQARGQRDRIVDAHRYAEQQRSTLAKCNAANILELTRADRLVGELRKERDQALRERDEVGCQLEALRAVQRDDLQVLVARIALVEADVRKLKEPNYVEFVEFPDHGNGEVHIHSSPADFEMVRKIAESALVNTDDDPDAGLEGLVFEGQKGGE